MSQGRWIDGRLVNEVFVVNQTSGGGGGGGVTEEQVTGIVSGYIASGISSDIIPTQSGAYDIGSASMPFKDGYFTSGSLYLADSHLFIDADQNLCIENTVISGEPLTTSGQVSGMLAAPKSSYSFIDAGTSATVTLSTRDGGLIVTDPFTESISNVDLGATTPDPGHLSNVFIDGTGRYSVGASTLNNANGLITLEYINSPGQFFVINDVDGGVFGPGDRQSFGLVRETLVDGTDLDGATGPLAGGNLWWLVCYLYLVLHRRLSLTAGPHYATSNSDSRRFRYGPTGTFLLINQPTVTGGIFAVVLAVSVRKCVGVLLTVLLADQTGTKLIPTV